MLLNLVLQTSVLLVDLSDLIQTSSLYYRSLCFFPLFFCVLVCCTEYNLVMLMEVTQCWVSLIQWNFFLAPG